MCPGSRPPVTPAPVGGTTGGGVRPPAPSRPHTSLPRPQAARGNEVIFLRMVACWRPHAQAAPGLRKGRGTGNRLGRGACRRTVVWSVRAVSPRGVGWSVWELPGPAAASAWPDAEQGGNPDRRPSHAAPSSSPRQGDPELPLHSPRTPGSPSHWLRCLPPAHRPPLRLWEDAVPPSPPCLCTSRFTPLCNLSWPQGRPGVRQTQVHTWGPSGGPPGPLGLLAPQFSPSEKWAS